MIRIIGELKIVHSQEFLVFLATHKHVTTVSGVNGSGQRDIEPFSQRCEPTVGHSTDLHKMELPSPGMNELGEGEEAGAGAAASSGVRAPAPVPCEVVRSGGGAVWSEAANPFDPLLEPSAETLRSLDAHFDKVFGALGPRHATARYLRRRLAAELHMHVEQRSRVEGCSAQAACSRAVLAALRMHERFLDNACQSKKHCVNSKYHNLLYAVAKLCFDCRLQDSEVVCCLLKAIFWCENSLDNLVVGALLGIVSTHVFNAWKSDFETRHENLQALDYFLEQAGRGGLRFDPDAFIDDGDDEEDEKGDCKMGGGGGGGIRGDPRPAALVATECPTPPGEAPPPPVRVPIVASRGPVGLADLPLRGYGKLRPLALAVLLANADAVLLLLRYGARPVDASPLYAWYGRRVADDNLAGCVRVLLRAVRWVEVVELKPDSGASGAFGAGGLPLLPADVMVFAKGSPEEALVPASRRRGASPPPPLKHLSRCAVRAALRATGTLPFGLRALELPAALRDYLDLLED